MYLGNFPSLLKNVFLSHTPTSRYQQKIASLKTIKIILVKEKNLSIRPELSILSTKPDVCLFTAREAGSMSKTTDGNCFQCHTEVSRPGKFLVPVSAEVLKLYLNVENVFFC